MAIAVIPDTKQTRPTANAIGYQNMSALNLLLSMLSLLVSALSRAISLCIFSSSSWVIPILVSEMSRQDVLSQGVPSIVKLSAIC